MQQPPDPPTPAPAQQVAAPNGQGFEAVAFLTELVGSLSRQRNQALDLLGQLEAQVNLLNRQIGAMLKDASMREAARQAEAAQTDASLAEMKQEIAMHNENLAFFRAEVAALRAEKETQKEAGRVVQSRITPVAVPSSPSDTGDLLSPPAGTP